MANGNSVKIRIDGDASNFEKSLRNIKTSAKAGLADIKAGIDMATAATEKLFGVAAKGVNYNASIEQLQTSFEVMSGSAEKAAEIVDRLRQIGAETPFETLDLAETTQMLMQYGLTADDAIARMRMLGDISQGSAEKMNRIAMAYGQMNSAGKVQLEDVKQMIEAGFNPLLEISERTGESMGSLYDRISKGTISVDEITQAMVNATSEGGRFFQSMEKQSQTLNGRLSTLRDNVDQLMGSLTSGLSDDLRTQLLPLATNIVEDLQQAFDSGGYQGIVNAATDMLPDLLGMMTGKLQDAIAGLSKWLPQGVKALMKAVPGAVRGAATVVPQITTALFEVANVVVMDLIGMLPELTPVLREGIGNLLKNVGTGAVTLIGSTLVSIFDLFGLKIEDGVDDLMDLVDEDMLLEISGHVDGTFDDSDLDQEEKAIIDRINTLTRNIQAALTDGLPDTKKVTGELKEGVDQLEEELVGMVQEAEQAQIDRLDPTAPDFTTACQRIREESQTTIDEIETLADGMIKYIKKMAGKPAEVVQEGYQALEENAAKMEAVAQRYFEAARAASREGQAFQAVRAGAATGEESVGLAVNYAVSSYNVDMQSAKDSRDAAIQQIISDFNSGQITQEESLELQLEAEAKFEIDRANVEREYRNNAREIIQGLAKTLSEEDADALLKYSEAKSLSDLLNNTLNQLMEGEISPIEIPEQVKNMLSDAYGGLFTALEIDAAETDGLSLFSPILQNIGELADNAKEEVEENLAGQEGLDVLATAWQVIIDKTGDFGAEEALGGMSITDALGSKLEKEILATEDAATAAAQDVAKAATDAEATTATEGATAAGEAIPEGTAVGIGTKAHIAVNKARLMAQQVVSAIKRVFNSNSPSKVAIGLGSDFGEGMSIGLQESMQNAVNVARRMSGEITTAAQINLPPMQVRVPDMQQSIEYALGSSQQPVNLYVNGRELARVTASDTQQAQNWHNRRIAMGVGK